jgi:hypothetical protein
MPDDEKLKSALEIALEKAEKLGAASEEEKLGAASEEEKQEARREELAAIAEALARRYLNGLPLRDLEIELAKLPASDAAVVRQDLKCHLLEAIDLESPGHNDKALTAIQQVLGESETVKSIGDLLEQYAGAVESAQMQNLPALKSAKLDELRQRGICGSAVEPSVESSQAWLDLRRQLSGSYRAQIDEIKRQSLQA